MKSSAILLTFTASAAFAGLPAPVPVPPSPAPSGWTFRSAPYLWAQGIEGTAGVLGTTGEVDMSFSDILSDLDFAYMGAFEARYGRFSIIADINYADTSDHIATRGVLFTGGDINMKQFLATVTLNWTVLDTPGTTIDLYGGVRLNNVDIDLDLASVAGGFVSQSGDEFWADAIVGVRFQTSLSDRWFLRASGDIGGGSSDFTWQAGAVLGYRVTESCSVGLGYRSMGTDYQSGGFTWDITAHGPVLGVELKF